MLRALEKEEQIALFDRAKYHPILRDYMWANQNQGLRDPRWVRSLIKQGAKVGVPDIILAYPAQHYHGLFIELKRTNKHKCKVSIEQRAMINLLNNAGYWAQACFGAQQAWEAIIGYLGEDLTKNAW